MATSVASAPAGIVDGFEREEAAGGAVGGFELAATKAEVADATSAELAVNEVNTGVVLLYAAIARGALARLKADNAQGEFYLTDVPGLLLSDGLKVDAFRTSDETASTGVNTRDDLAAAEMILLARKSKD